MIRKNNISSREREKEIKLINLDIRENEKTNCYYSEK
jgi:hypothetical protein